MLHIDLLFAYKYTLRYLFIQKLGNVKNTYNLPKINKLIFYFFFKKFEDFDDVQIYNSFYMFMFFFGRKAYFSRNKSYFTLGKWFYNLDVKLILNKEKEIYFLLYYYFNNILFNVEKSFIKFGYLNKNFNIYFFLLKDVNIFSELKTNLGLFNLKVPFSLNIYITGCDYKNTKTPIILKNLKIIN